VLIVDTTNSEVDIGGKLTVTAVGAAVGFKLGRTGSAANVSMDFGNARWNSYVTNGVFLVSDTSANVTDKKQRFGVHHYTVAEEPFLLWLATSNVSANTMNIGGGTSDGNAATAINFYTAADNVTVTGTKRLALTATDLTSEVSQIIDVTSTEALLVRKDADAGDVFTVDTTNSIVTATANVYPGTDDTYYLGKNDDDSPFAWKGVIVKDTTDGKYYRIEVISGVVTATDLTD